MNIYIPPSQEMQLCKGPSSDHSYTVWWNHVCIVSEKTFIHFPIWSIVKIKELQWQPSWIFYPFKKKWQLWKGSFKHRLGSKMFVFSFIRILIGLQIKSCAGDLLGFLIHEKLPLCQRPSNDHSCTVLVHS